MKSLFDALQRGVRVVLTAVAFTLFFLGGTLLAWVVFPLIALFVRERHYRARICQRLLRSAFRLFHWYMRFVRILHFEPRSVGVTLPEGPCVIIANHPTLVDVTALLTLFDRATVVSKPAMYRNPLIGWLLRFCLHIEGARDSMTDGGRVLRDCLERLEQGYRVLIFPEGTRSPVGGLGAFKRGAFEIANRAGVPLCRFGIRCVPPVLSRQHPWWTVPRRTPRLIVTQLSTQSPANWQGGTIAMAREVQMDYDTFVNTNT